MARRNENRKGLALALAALRDADQQLTLALQTSGDHTCNGQNHLAAVRDDIRRAIDTAEETGGPICPECDGAGEVATDRDSITEAEEYGTCPVCNGTGRI
jgi:hypothetical protein